MTFSASDSPDPSRRQKKQSALRLPLFEIGFLTLLVLLMLVLGSDSYFQKTLRMFFCGILLIPLSFNLKKIFPLSISAAISIILLGSVVLFQVIRCVYFYFQSATIPEDVNFLTGYAESLKRWDCYFIVFVAGYLIFNNKKSVNRLLNTIAWGGFFLAVNIIPALLLSDHQPGYTLSGGRAVVFFYPVFYFHDFVAKYLLGTFGHPNYVGDVIALGFFSALGLVFYGIREFLERKRKKDLEFTREVQRNLAVFISLRIFMAFVAATAVVLLFSRGTILCFVLAVVVYLVTLILKIRSKVLASVIVVFLIGAFGFLSWSVNLGEVWKEMQTLEREVGEDAEGSISTNKEGLKRALGIYQDHKLWGVGTYGYKKLAKEYASPDTWDELTFTRFQSMCHYVHLLAEEGFSAGLYFLFLVTFSIAVLSGIFLTQSQYKFLTCLALFTPVVMILLHAAFNHLMQRFSMSMLVYALMGASLGVLRSDFKHS